MKYFKVEDNFLKANFECKCFQDALDFINRVGNISETYNHHPNIYLHDYKFVSFEITTHEKGNTITQKDKALAELIELTYKK